MSYYIIKCPICNATIHVHRHTITKIRLTNLCDCLKKLHGQIITKKEASDKLNIRFGIETNDNKEKIPYVMVK